MRKKLLNNLGLKLASLGLAFILWFLVVQIEDPQDSKTFNGVTVKLINTEVLDKAGKVYEVLENTDQARVTVYAPKSIIGQIRGTDIVAEADVSKLTDINTVAIEYYVENLEVDIVEGNRDVVRLSVEDKSSKWLRLFANTNGAVADGYMLYSTSLDQTNIEITGPESAISLVEYAAVEMGVSGATNNLYANVEIQLYDKEGNPVSNSNIVKNVNYAYMTVEVLATKEVPIEIGYTGEPAEGYMATGAMESTMQTVKLAGRASILENVNVITIPAEDVDITGAQSNVTRIVNLKEYLPDNVKFAEKSFNSKMTATVYVEPIVDKEILIPAANLAVVNLPRGLEAEIPADVESYSLTISGLARYITSVRQESVTGYADMAAYMVEQELEELQPGVYTVPVTINLPEEVSMDTEINMNITVSLPEDEE